MFKSFIKIFLILAALEAQEARAALIDFEDMSDDTPIRTHYSALGVEFVRATTITAGSSLTKQPPAKAGGFE